jgi:hypothetical protein
MSLLELEQELEQTRTRLKEEKIKSADLRVEVQEANDVAEQRARTIRDLSSVFGAVKKCVQGFVGHMTELLGESDETETGNLLLDLKDDMRRYNNRMHQIECLPRLHQ